MNKYLQKSVIIALMFTGFTLNLNAQNVGVNATGVAPNVSAGLDIDFTNKGVLVPRVALTSTVSNAPIGATVATSLLIYNTATAGAGATAVTPGYYYWGGAAWIRFAEDGDAWKILGNAGTISGTNFLGTTDAQALDFRTNNVIRFRVANGNQVHAMSLGTTALPFYSWSADANTGMWSAAADQLNFSTAGSERLELGTTEAVINDISANYDFRVEGNGNANVLFVDGGNDNVGVGTGTPVAAAMLDVTSTNKGFLAPRMALTARNSNAPIGGGIVAGMLVYNTATAGAAPNNVLPGYYYWDGAQWVAFGGTGGRDWALLGNSGTVAGTNFLGTTDAQAVNFRTNNLIRFTIPNASQVHAESNGTAALPFYSRSADPNTGMYFSAADQLSFSEGGTEALRITNNDRILALDGSALQPTWSFMNDIDIGMYRIGVDILGFATNGTERVRINNTETVVNENSLNYDFRVESNGQPDMFVVDGGTDRIGVNVLAPTMQWDFLSTGAAGWVTQWVNTFAAGGTKLINHTNAGNGSRVMLGVTNYSASAFAASAVMGLSLNGTTTGSGGIGVIGHANNESGDGVQGTLTFAGPYVGWAGWFNADVWCSGTYFGSDRRLKRDIKAYSGALAVIDKIDPVSYYYDTEKYPGVGFDENRLQYGFIAQDLEKVIPEMVKDKKIHLNTNRPRTAGEKDDAQETGIFKVVNYSVMIPILTQAVKEQQALIEAQNQKIEELENLIKNK